MPPLAGPARPLLGRKATQGLERRPSCRRRPCRWAKAVASLPGDDSVLLRYEAEDFELVRELGQLSLETVSQAGPTVSWRQDDDAVPDTLRIDASLLGSTKEQVSSHRLINQI